MDSEQLKWFMYGAKKMVEYILFCFRDYQYRLNLAGINKFFKDIIRFADDCDLNIEKAYFRNTISNIGFKEFVEKKYVRTR